MARFIPGARLRLAARIDAFWENPVIQGLAQGRGLGLCGGLQFIQALDEQKVGELFHHGQGVRHHNRPEVVPNAVDLVSNFTYEQGAPSRSG